MPPKGSKKAQSAPTKDNQSEPAKETKQSEPAKDNKDSPPKARKPKEPIVWTPVESEVPSMTSPVAVKFKGLSVVAKPPETKKESGFTHELVLSAPAAFSIKNTFVFPADHVHAGKQAILIEPAKGFPFMEIPEEARVRVYRFYFGIATTKGGIEGPIELDGKRSGSKEMYAKTYAGGSKNRVALLATNTEIYKIAVDVLYNHPIKVENSTVLVDFILGLAGDAISRFRSIIIKTVVRTSMRNCLNALIPATKLEKLHILGGLAASDDVDKLAKWFHAEGHKFLEAMAHARGGDKAAAVGVLSFGKNALVYADKNKEIPWTSEMRDEFKTTLVGKLK